MAGLSCSEQLLRMFLFVFNAAFFVIGVILIAMGVFAIVSVSDFKDFDVDAIMSISGVFIAVGLVVFIIAFLGCCGAFKKSHWMMYAYSIAILVLLLLQVAMGIYAIVERGAITDVFSDSLDATQEDYQTDRSTQKAWDALQEKLECCGNATGPSSWAVAYPNTVEVPDSCCIEQTDGCGAAITAYTDADIFQKDCVKVAETKIDDSLIALGLVAIILGLIQIVGILAGCCLGNAFRDYEQVE